jgi:hypothetical protein
LYVENPIFVLIYTIYSTYIRLSGYAECSISLKRLIMELINDDINDGVVEYFTL